MITFTLTATARTLKDSHRMVEEAMQAWQDGADEGHEKYRYGEYRFKTEGSGDPRPGPIKVGARVRAAIEIEDRQGEQRYVIPEGSEGVVQSYDDADETFAVKFDCDPDIPWLFDDVDADLNQLEALEGTADASISTRDPHSAASIAAGSLSGATADEEEGQPVPVAEVPH